MNRDATILLFPASELKSYPPGKQGRRPDRTTFQRTERQLEVIAKGHKLEDFSTMQVVALIDWTGVEIFTPAIRKNVWDRVATACAYLDERPPEAVGRPDASEFLERIMFRAVQLGCHMHTPCPFGTRISFFNREGEEALVVLEDAPRLERFDPKPVIGMIADELTKRGGVITRDVESRFGSELLMSASFDVPNVGRLVYDFHHRDDGIQVLCANDEEALEDHPLNICLWTDGDGFMEHDLGRFPVVGPQKMALYRNALALPLGAWTTSEEGRPRGRCVYLITAADGRVKVGVSGQPRTRVVNVLANSGVEPLAIHCTPATMNAGKVETVFKRTFHERRIAGEWFDLDAKRAVDFIEQQVWEWDSLARLAADRESARAHAARQNEWLDELFRKERRSSLATH